MFCSCKEATGRYKVQFEYAKREHSEMNENELLYGYWSEFEINWAIGPLMPKLEPERVKLEELTWSLPYRLHKMKLLLSCRNFQI